MPGQFKLMRSRDGRTYFRLESGEGRILLESKSYGKICAAEAGIETLKRAVRQEKSVSSETSANGKPRVIVKGGNGQVVAVGPKAKSSIDTDVLRHAIQVAASDAAVIDARKR